MTGPDDLADEERLRRIERGVLHRIDRPKRIARGLAGGTLAVALFAGGVALLLPGGIGVGSAGSGGGASGAQGTGARDQAEDGRIVARITIRCHSGPDLASDSVPVEIAPEDLPASAIAACADPVQDLSAPASGAPVPAVSDADLVACIDTSDRISVFPVDGDPATVCKRNDLLELG